MSRATDDVFAAFDVGRDEPGSRHRLAFEAFPIKFDSVLWLRGTGAQAVRHDDLGLLESLSEMNGVIVRTTLQLITPGILFVFGAAFVCAWLVEKKRNYLLLLAGACVLFCPRCDVADFELAARRGAQCHRLGRALHVGGYRRRGGHPGAFGEGARSGHRYGNPCRLRSSARLFLYIDRSLIARVYIQNFGYGLLMLIAAGRAHRIGARGLIVDRALFWVLLLFGLHFFPRTLLTVGFSAPVDRTAFSNSMFWQALQLSLAVLGAGLARWPSSPRPVSDMIDDLRRERDLDLLTGILNRRGFQERVSAHLRKHGPSRAALALCDIDNFKSINDTLGHDVGDDVLGEVGRMLRNASRKRDIVGRLGGEEFAVFLPDTDEQEAVDYAERLRVAIEQNSFAVPGGAEARSLRASAWGRCSREIAGRALYKRSMGDFTKRSGPAVTRQFPAR